MGTLGRKAALPYSFNVKTLKEYGNAALGIWQCCFRTMAMLLSFQVYPSRKSYYTTLGVSIGVGIDVGGGVSKMLKFLC